MVASEVEKIVLDYAGAEGLDDILTNLSGVATAGRFLWTASDEGRTVECLEPSGDGYRLRKQHHLGCLFDGLPDERDDGDDTPAEADMPRRISSRSRSALERCGFAARIATFAFKPRRIARRRRTDAPTV